MEPLGDGELLTMIEGGESDLCEFKESFNNTTQTKVRQAVCAFANDLPNHQKPGVIFIGLNDTGKSAGLEITDALLVNLANIKSDGNIIPPPTLTVARKILNGMSLAVITVWPAFSPPVSYDGRIWIRTGSRRDQATAQDERILIEKRRHKDRSFDTYPVPDSHLTDLNKQFFEMEYLPQAVAADVLEANGRSYEQRLASLGMIASVDDPRPTVVGLLTLGVSPRTWIPCAYIQFLRINGAELGDPVIDEQEIDGTFDLVLRRLDEKIKAHLSIAVNFSSGSTTEVRTATYPLLALQQLTRNAVLHRTYENTNAPVKIYWFDDRIEISNPGGPYGIVTAENFGRDGINDYRNPSIAAVLKTLGFVQRFGFGIAAAQRALADNGNPPAEFKTEPTIVLATIRRAI